MKLFLIIIQFLCGIYLIGSNLELNTVRTIIFFSIGLFFLYDASKNLARHHENR